MPNYTVSLLIRSITARLSNAGIKDSAIDARLLVRHAFGWSAEQLISMSLKRITSSEIDLIEDLVLRRLEREPLQYIVGKVEFFRRQFTVNRSVLIPRPETELLVMRSKKFIQQQRIEQPRIADVCTGSGAIAITLSLEMPGAEVHATDISLKALKVAAKNTENLNAEVTLHQGDLLESLSGEFDVIVSNPPYVLQETIANLQPEVLYEPRLAIDGGPDGLKHIRPLISTISTYMRSDLSAAYLEVDPPVAGPAMELVRCHLPDTSVSLLTDLSGLSRCIAVERR